jgi:acetamidase/formamidase
MSRRAPGKRRVRAELTVAEHIIDAARIHHEWDSELEPTLQVASGDVVHFDLRMAGHGQVENGRPIEEIEFDFDTLYNLLGPIWVEGAHAGDSLEIEIVDLTPGPWGWTVVLPELGLLPEDFPTAFIRYFDLADTDHARLCPGVTIPLAPFLGTMGTHPGTPTRAVPFPPHRGGGNIDTRHLVAGSTLWLPVWCEGALFSCGDPHAAQGDGEVCVAAIECDMQASLRFTLRNATISAPHFQVVGPLTPRTDPGGYHGTMGIDSDLMVGAKKAVRAMIEWLEVEQGLSHEDAYVLSSLAGDLKILEIVDAGVWNLGFTLPLEVFKSP